MQLDYHKSDKKDPWPRAKAKHFRDIDGLLEYMDIYGYSSPYDV